MLTGENLFMTVFTNTSSQKRQVNFAAPYSGKIIPLDLSEEKRKKGAVNDDELKNAKKVNEK